MPVGAPPMRGRVGPSIRHGQLQRERLVEAQPVPTVRYHRPFRRLMHCPERCLELHYVGCVADPGRQRILDASRNPAPARRSPRWSRCATCRSSDRGRRRHARGRGQRRIVLGAADDCAVLVDDDEVGVGELQSPLNL